MSNKDESEPHQSRTNFISSATQESGKHIETSHSLRVLLATLAYVFTTMFAASLFLSSAGPSYGLQTFPLSIGIWAFGFVLAGIAGTKSKAAGLAIAIINGCLAMLALFVIVGIVLSAIGCGGC
jgi:hypothetical protein